MKTILVHVTNVNRGALPNNPHQHQKCKLYLKTSLYNLVIWKKIQDHVMKVYRDGTMINRMESANSSCMVAVMVMITDSSLCPNAKNAAFLPKISVSYLKCKDHVVEHSNNGPTTVQPTPVKNLFMVDVKEMLTVLIVQKNVNLNVLCSHPLPLKLYQQKLQMYVQCQAILVPVSHTFPVGFTTPPKESALNLYTVDVKAMIIGSHRKKPVNDTAVNSAEEMCVPNLRTLGRASVMWRSGFLILLIAHVSSLTMVDAKGMGIDFLHLMSAKKYAFVAVILGL